MTVEPSSNGGLLFQRRKLKIALGIMGVGMLLALEWAGWQAWVVGSSYPYNTFLFLPQYRYTDYSDNVYTACLPNPYDDPVAFYLPLTWALFRLVSPLPCTISLIVFLFVSLGGLILVLRLALAKIVPQPGPRTFVAFLAVAISYPVAMCVDRGNVEILMALVVAVMLYLLHRGRYWLAAFCLMFAISLKLYPVLLLTLFWRQRKLGPILVIGGGAIVLTLGAMGALSLSFPASLQLYSQNLAFFLQRDVYENYDLEGSASLWNPFKYALLKAADWGIIAPVDFSFDGRFIQATYAIYNAFMVTAAAALVVHVTLIEREATRCAIMLLLYMGIAVPSGADYRLLYVGVALVLHILSTRYRSGDWSVVVLLALVMVPKKEFFLHYLGESRGGGGDQVPIQVILNPVCVALAVVLLLRGGWALYDANWSRLRARRLLRSVRQFRLVTP